MGQLSYRGQKVAILGYGLEGQAAYRYWSAKGADITICDQQTGLKLPPGVDSRLGESYLQKLDDFDLIVRSPGVMPYEVKTSQPVTSVLSEFLAVCQGVVIGVTGSKGKGTVSTLIYDILRADGKTAFLGGNIGKPPLDFVDQLSADSFSVIEMSNLQLWDVTRSPQIAVVLMLAPEHLDWHRGDLKEYLGTKANITKFQGPNDLLVYDPSNSYAAAIARKSEAKSRPYNDKAGVYLEQDQIKYLGKPICKAADLPLLGKHNLINACAAIAATVNLVKVSSIKKAIRNTKPLPHRLELVATVNGVKYYDDSIATTPEAAIVAINSFIEPKVLILGGADKGVEYTQLAETMTVQQPTIRGVVLVGQMADKIKTSLTKAGFTGVIKEKAQDMRTIIKQAGALAQTGDVVLLSPACASFDMFKSYSDRGEQFKQAVKTLKT